MTNFDKRGPLSRSDAYLPFRRWCERRALPADDTDLLDLKPHLFFERRCEIPSRAVATRVRVAVATAKRDPRGDR
jgi:hypothetical protein